jgi:beta-lactamase class A
MASTLGPLPPRKPVNPCSTRNSTKWVGVLVTSLVLVVALTGCTSPQQDTNLPNTDNASAMSEPELHEQMLWMLRALNSNQEVSIEELAPRLDSSVFDSAKAAELISVMNTNLRPFAPFTITAFDSQGADGIAELRNRMGMLVNLEVSVNPDGAIRLWLLSAAAAKREPATSLQEISERLADIADETTLLVQKATHGEVKDLFELDSSVEGPMASVAKLYVLGATADAVRSGDLDWESALTVTEQAKSLPTGELQNSPDGTQITVLNAAELMMRISDNTATDLLIEAVGQDRLAHAVEELGHRHPPLLTPFPSTRNMFQLTLGGNQSLSEQWKGADGHARAGILAALPVEPAAILEDWESRAPFWPDGLDWFGSATDMAEAHRVLYELALDDPFLLQVLEQAEPGPSHQDAIGKWDHVSRKTGSSPGAVAVSILAVDADGTVYSIAAQGSVGGEIAEIELRKAEFIDLVDDALTLVAQ